MRARLDVPGVAATAEQDGREATVLAPGREAPLPRMNLLAPRLPARRVRVVARWTVALLVVALLDLAAVSAWLGVEAMAARTEQEVAEWAARRAAAEARAASFVPAVRAHAALKQRWEALQAVDPPTWDPARVAQAAVAALPAGTRLTEIEVAPGGQVHLTGVAPSYAAVDAFVQDLGRSGVLTRPWVQQMARTEEGTAVVFDVEAHLVGAGVGEGGQP